MSKFCPITNSKVVYLVCQECEDRVCEQRPRVSILPKRAAKPTEEKKMSDSVNTPAEFTNPTQTGQSGPYESCETCYHKTGEYMDNIFGHTHVTRCEVYHNRLINSEGISWEGCPYHNKDLSQERICMNCEHFLGGGDWGLACAANYHALPEALSNACDKFQKKKQ